jgi:hypothetical protein
MKKPIQRDLFPGALEMMILRTLKRQPMHGYALVQQINGLEARFWIVSEFGQSTQNRRERRSLLRTL